MHQTDDGITERRHDLRNAATAHLGPSFIERHIADPMDVVLDRPMLPDQAQQPLGISLIIVCWVWAGRIMQVPAEQRVFEQ